MLVLVLALLSADAPAQLAQETAQEAFFETQVRPLLAAHCYDCHNADEQQGGIRLDLRAQLFANENGYRPVVPHDPKASRILQVAAYADDDIQMPPDGKLPDAALATLRRWIASGAYHPADGEVESTDPWPRLEDGSIDFAAAQQTHWAYRPIARPSVPPVPVARRNGGAKTPIDAFVIRRLGQERLNLSPPADRRTLIRRLYHDALGLPPTFEQIEAFARDDDPTAYERLVDRVLADPHYGERWGRHWLDLARYADTKGYVGGEKSIKYPYAYTYRDWVIDALNADLPYDDFVRHQIAADRVAPDDPTAWAALGFLNVGNRYINNTHEINNDRIDVLTTAFLGTTVACARCHDHKFDPVPQSDYWAMAGVFDSSYEPTEPPLIDPSPNGPQTQARREFWAAYDAEKATVEAIRTEEIDAVKADLTKRMADYLLAAAGNQTWLPKHTPDPPLHERAVTWMARWLKQTPQSPVAVALKVAAEDRGKPPAQFADAALTRLRRFDQKTKWDVSPAILSYLAGEPGRDDLRPKTYASLVRWVGSRYAALTERQAGGAALDGTEQALLDAFAVGRNPLTVDRGEYHEILSQKPRRRIEAAQAKVTDLVISHPGAPPRAMALFDKEQPSDSPIFIRGDRGRPGDRTPRRTPQIVAPQSDPYGDSESGRAKLADDIASPDNPLTARVIVNRLWQRSFGRGLVATPSDFGTRGERPSHPDLLDYLAGRLIDDGWSLKRLHREILLSAVYRQRSDVRPDAEAADPENRLLARQTRRRLAFEPMRDAMLQAAGRLDESIGGPAVDRDRPRRSVYQRINRNDLPGELLTFDFPSPDTPIAVRSQTTVPQQALHQMNSPAVQRMANAIVQQTAIPRLPALYRRTLGRLPSPTEAERARAFLADGGNLQQLAQVLLLSNEFHFVD